MLDFVDQPLAPPANVIHSTLEGGIVFLVLVVGLPSLIAKVGSQVASSCSSGRSLKVILHHDSDISQHSRATLILHNLQGIDLSCD